MKYRNLYRNKRLDGNTEFRFLSLKPGYRSLSSDDYDQSQSELPKGSVFKRSAPESSGFTASCMFPFEFEGHAYNPRGGKSWRTNEAGMKRLVRGDRLFLLGTKLYFKLYFDDFPKMSLLNTWSDTVAG